MARGAGASSRRWLFADQLGPQFLDDPDQPVLLIESRAVLRRRRFHRQEAHLLLVGLRALARELGERAVLVQADTYDDGLRRCAELTGEDPAALTVVQPTSHAADRWVRGRGLAVVADDRGVATTREDLTRRVSGRERARGEAAP